MRATAVASCTLWCHALQRHGPAGPCCPSLATNALASLHETAGTQTPCVQSVSLVLQRVLLLWRRSSSTFNAESPAIAAAAAASSADYRNLQTTHLIGGSWQRPLLPGWFQAWAALRGYGTGTSPSMHGKESRSAGKAGHGSSSSSSSSSSMDSGSRGGGRMAGGGAPVTKASATATAREATAQVRKEAGGVVRSSGGGGSGPGAKRQSAAIDAPLLTSWIKGSTDAASLVQLVERYQHCNSFNHIHAAAALTRFAKLAQQQRLPGEHGRVWVARLTGIAKRHLQTAEVRQQVNMLHAVATLQSKTQLGPPDPGFVEQLVAGLESKVSGFNGQDLSNTLWALATLGVTGHRAFTTQLVAAAQQKLPELTEQALSNSLWALATLSGDQHSHSRLIQAWVKEAESRLSDFKPQELSNSLWALATLCGDQHSHNHFIQAWVREAQGRLSGFNAQELSNSLWALATLCGDQHNHSAIIQAWVREAEGRLSEFNPQNLSNSLWALATLCGDQHNHSAFIQAWVSEAEGRLSGFKPQELSNSLWALAILRGDQHSHSHFIQAWVRETEGRLSGFNAQALANSLWALAKLGHTDCRFTARLLQAARAQLPVFNAQAVSNTALALGTLQYQDPDFMRRLVQQAKSRLPDMTPQALANTLWAMACLNHNDAAFVDDAVRCLLQRRGSFNTQGLCNTLWALCILDHSPAAVLQPLLAEAQPMLLRPDTTASHLVEQQQLSRRQAYQYLVTMEGQGHISPQLKAQYRQLWEVCQAAWAGQLQQGARASFTQQQVLQAVRELPGCEGATCEQLTEDGLLSIDVALQLPEGGKVAVEVDGPTHFMANAPGVPDGSTAWRNRMLQLRGWSVVSVPAVEWSRVGSNTEKQRSYLLQRFAQAGVQPRGRRNLVAARAIAQTAAAAAGNKQA